MGVTRDANFFASDMPAILEYTHNFIVINDYEAVRITREKVEIYDLEGSLITREPFRANWNLESAEK